MVMRFRIVVFAVAIATLSITTKAEAPAATTGTEGFALDAVRREAVVTRAAGLQRLRSLLVSVDGELIEEHYFNGTTERSLANLKSASKTLISILVGIAIDRGYVSGVNEPIATFFPTELAEASEIKRSITVEDLLTMRSGLETTSNRNYGRWVQSQNWVSHALSRPVVDEPGGQMIYSTGSTHLLSSIITRATGMSTRDFGHRYLARPLGVSLPAWPQDPQGIFFGGNDMLLTPRSMVAVGELYRRGGMIDGFEVVTSTWVRESWIPRTVSRYSRRQYGYGWWMRVLNGYPTYYAWGYGGQFIYVIPDLDAVIVATSSPNPGDGRRDHRRALNGLIEHELVPAIRDALNGSKKGL
jgi:CubicO group peptidase (beta-lactamase class C family)